MAISLHPEASTDREARRGAPLISRLRVRSLSQGFSSNYVLLLAIVLLLVAIGLVMVLSSSSIDSYAENDSFFSTFIRQGAFALVGVPLMLALGGLPVRMWRRLAWIAFGGALAVQCLVFSPLGREVGGNRNWLRIGAINLQPSELLKLALILWLATVLATKGDRIARLGELFVPAGLGAVIAIGLVLLGKDLGTAMILVLIAFSCLYFARIPLRYFIGMTGVAVVAVIAFAVTSPNRLNRIAQFLQPDCSDYLGTCWQSVHGLWALANGGVLGVGLGNSTAKWSWLPAAENDYIFAILGEELGLLGAALVLALFVFLAFVLARIMMSAPDSFSRIAVGGILIWTVGQAFVNIAVVVGLLPVLGVPLPFISSGGSALLSALAAMGFCLSVARENPTPLLARGMSDTRGGQRS